MWPVFSGQKIRAQSKPNFGLVELAQWVGLKLLALFMGEMELRDKREMQGKEFLERNGEYYGGILKNKYIKNMLILELTYSNENKINIFL